MVDRLEPQGLMREISDLGSRLSELKQAASMPQSDVRTTLDAALVELELAVAALSTISAGQAADDGRSATSDSERRVLRTVFTEAPVPLFLLDRAGTVRRVNRQAASLLDTTPGYVAGKPFTVFCELSTRAALRSQLAGVVRTGRRRRADVRFLSKQALVAATVTLARVWIKGEPDPLVIAVVAPHDGQVWGAPPAEEPREAGDAVARVVHRMDVLSTAIELLLDEPAFSETVAMRRCARLLAAELAEWVLIDVSHDGELRRQVVIGPDDERSREVARSVESIDPQPGTLAESVHNTRETALRAHVEDLESLGSTPDGMSVCGLVGATSIMSVPIDDGERGYGVLTLTGTGEHGPFDLIDLGVVQRMARYLALVIRAARQYHRRAAMADTLQASLLPRSLPTIPGVSLDARYVAATRGMEVGGDFYDVCKTPDGWGFVLGDVCGKGEEAAAVTAVARHGIRLLSRWQSKPADVLSMVNAVLLDEDRFVTAVLACVEPRDRGLGVTLGTAGHQPAILIRRDGVIRTMSGGGLPLGLFDDFEPAIESLDLDEGDTLILHSDGVLDACDVGRERFGHERLIEVLAQHSTRPLNEILIAVEQALMDFCEGDVGDDISILALRVLPESLN
ncbi:MAG TPA: SpoIIE family protein phosphatase [Streptosporangiaceae bacterium]|jgi:serine phosphatase RsbU (regulator of sigma subunit)/PAS domain-containing protein|nr:SpoIIE family protein phosphatase [Streptosporangiaceae bacterium]